MSLLCDREWKLKYTPDDGVLVTLFYVPALECAVRYDQLSQALGRVALILFFILILTPVGFILRLAGKDPLQLQRPANADTFWRTAKAPGPLDRLF